MADELNVTNPSSNQILVYDSVEQAFVNVDPSLSIFGNTTYITGGMNLGTEGENLFNNTVSNVMRFRRIRGKNGIDVTGSGSYIDISFNGDAETLGGLSRSGFLEQSKNLSDVNATVARGNLNVYSSAETDSKYLFANQTNIPDVDAVYDLGANGRRYADMYAVTFHGLATESVVSQTLQQNGARNNQVLTWIDGDGWVPRDSSSTLLSELGDVSLNNIQHESILVYNGIRNIWETAPISSLGSIGGSGGGAGSIVDAENVGDGVGTYFARFGGNLQFRSVSAGDNITVTTNFNNEEIVISADVPENTDGLPEGNNNKYFTNQRVRDALSTVSIQNLGSMDAGSPTQGQAPVWNGVIWEFTDVATNVNTSDDVIEGSTNLYYTQNRTFTDIGEYLVDSNNGIALNELKDVDATASNGTFLYSDGSRWVNRSLQMSDISNVSLTGLSNGSSLVYNSSSSKFEVGNFPTNLIDLGETPDSLHFTQGSFDTFFSGKTTDQLAETSQNRFLNNTNLVNALQQISINNLSDVDTSSIADSNVLVWSSSQSAFVPADSSSLNVSVNMGLRDLNDVDEGSVLNAEDGQVLSYNGSTSVFELSDISQSLVGLTDVSTGSIVDGDVLAYRAGTFEPRKLVPFDDSNVPSQGSILQYNTSLSAFEVVAGGSIGVENLNDLLDVVITSVNGNDLITYDNSLHKYVNKSVSDTVDILQLGGVSTSGLSAGQGLIYDGSQFLNTDVLPYTITSASNNDVLRYNSFTQKFENSNLSELTGITATSGSASEVLKYNTVSGKFTNQLMDLDDLSNVTDYSAADQSMNILVWNAGSGSYQITDLASSFGLESLSDVDVVDLLDGSVVSYSTSTGLYEIKKHNVLSSGDVNASGILDGESLIWNDAQGEFISGMPSIALGDISDVSQITPHVGDTITWDGAEYTFTSTNESYTNIVMSSNALEFWGFNGALEGYINNTVLIPSSSYGYSNAVGIFGSGALGAGTTYDTTTLPTIKNITGNVGSVTTSEAENLSFDFWYRPSTNIDFGDGSLVYEVAALSLVAENVVGASIKVALVVSDDAGTIKHTLEFYKNGTQRNSYPLSFSVDKINHVAISYTKNGANSGVSVVVNTVLVVDETVTTSIDNDTSYDLVVDILSELGTGSEPYTIDKLCVYDNTQTQDTILRKYTNVVGNGDTSIGGSDGSIGDNVDVELNNTQIGDILVFNGSEFINQPASSSSDSLNDLTDVGLSVPSTSEVIRYNGSQWVNQKIDYTDLDSTPQIPDSLSELVDVDETVTPTDSQVLTFNASTSKYEPRDAAGGTSGTSVYEFVATAGQTDFSVSHDNDTLVFVNGLLMPVSEVDDVTDNTLVTLNTPRVAGDNVRILVIHDPLSGTPTNTTASVTSAVANEFTMSTGQTEITFTHSGSVMVYANGILLPMGEVDTTNNAKITLNTARNSGDIIRIVDFV